MTLQDKRFRTDGKTIEPCCKKMQKAFVKVEKYPSGWYVYFDTTRYYYCLSYCKFCGAKLEYVERLDGGK